MPASIVRHQHSLGDSVVAALLVAIAAVVVAGIGPSRRWPGMDRYQTLEQPRVTPPGGTFGIVWSSGSPRGSPGERAGTRPTARCAVQTALSLLWTVPSSGSSTRSAGSSPVAGGRDGSARRCTSTTLAAVPLFPNVVRCGYAIAVGIAVLN